jgi:hypothetical protein
MDFSWGNWASHVTPVLAAVTSKNYFIPGSFADGARIKFPVPVLLEFFSF